LTLLKSDWMENILFISHKKAQCGVYEFGKDIFDVLKSSAKYNFVRAECASGRFACCHIAAPAGSYYLQLSSFGIAMAGHQDRCKDFSQ